MIVRRSLSLDEIFEKVKCYDLVFTQDASMMSALNDRIEEPRLGHFAVTPLIYTRQRVPRQLLGEKELFTEIVQKTSLSWKQASYILENVLSCWEHTGSPTRILQYSMFNTKKVESIVESIQGLDTVYKAMNEIRVPKHKQVAVVNIEQFNEVDKQVLPKSYKEVNTVTKETFSLEPFKIFSSATQIVETVCENIQRHHSQDVGIVMKQDTQYSRLIESSLEAKNIDTMRKTMMNEDEHLRLLIQLLRLSLNYERRKVKHCKTTLQRLGYTVPVQKQNEYVSRIDGDNATEIIELLKKVKASTVKQACSILKEHVDEEEGLRDVMEQLQALGILHETVSTKLCNNIEHYFQTFPVEKESPHKGVLLANPTSSAIINRPIVFYIGMGTDWAPTIPSKPWINKERQDELKLEQFKTLIQNGEQQHYLVQNKTRNQDVTPCVYFNELTDKPFTTFQDLPNEAYYYPKLESEKPFAKQEYEVDIEQETMFSQSALRNFVTSPKQYLFDRLVQKPDQDYFRKGTLYHDYAEFYANHKETVKQQRKKDILEMMMNHMESIIDSIDKETLRTEFHIATKNIEEYIDNTDITPFLQPEDIQKPTYKDTNLFAQQFNKPIQRTYTEVWFQNEDLGVKGKIDLLQNPQSLIDYKSGNKKNAANIVRNSKLNLLKKEPQFQAILYLLQQRTQTPNKELRFTFFHFLDNINQEMSKRETSIEDNIVTITYYPETFNDFVGNKEVFDYIMQSSRTKGKVSETNNRRKTLEIRSNYSTYKEFFQNHDIDHDFDKQTIQESELAQRFVEHYVEDVGDYKYVEEGCLDALKKIVSFRYENYFKEDLDAFQEFLQEQLSLLNTYKKEGFPKKNPGVDIETDDLELKDLIPR